MLKVIVNGARGRLGQVASAAIQAADDLELVAQSGRKDDLSEVIQTTQANVVLDVTTAESVYSNAQKIIAADAHPVIGTSGLKPEQITQLQKQCDYKQLGGIIVPNFALGSVLMMQFAAQAARYFESAEIIELHHDKKQDAPSGTAVKTADLISQVRPNAVSVSQETMGGALGARYQNVPIHSVRLPGLLAHQQVMFGKAGEVLTIKHDTSDRQSFEAGLLLACRKVSLLKHLVYGLENIL